MRRREAAVAAAALVVTAMVVLAVQPVAAVLPVELEVRAQDGTVSIDYAVGAAQFPYRLIVSVMPVDRPGGLPGLVLVDADNRSGTSAAVAGLYDHFTTELWLRGLEANVTIVEMQDLLSVLNDTSPVVVFSEPVARDNETAARLMEWVEQGGRMVCIGPRSLPFRQEAVDGRWVGPEGFLRIKYVELDRAGEGATASAYAEALSLRAVAPYRALDKGHLDNLSAVTVGFTYAREAGDLVTAAMVPLGEGRVVLFGGQMQNPAMISGDLAFAWDIIQMHLGGAFFSTAPPQHVALSESKEARDGSLVVAVDGAAVVMAYSDRDYVPAFGRTTVAAAS